MNNRDRILRYFSDYPDGKNLSAFLPIIEIAGAHRVLIENHHGILQYCSEKVAIRVPYGETHVLGCNLLLRQMTKSKLVISGTIEDVKIIRSKRV